MPAYSANAQHALKRQHGKFNFSARELLDKIAPPREVAGLPIRDARGTRQITQKDLEGGLRIPRRDVANAHHVELVATMRHYDGHTGGAPGYYANIFVVYRIGTKTWRTGGVRVLPFEAERIARALVRGSNTKPGSDEPERLAGTLNSTSELRAHALGDGAVLLYVKFAGQGGRFMRSRGVEVRESERAAIADGLRSFAAMRGRAR